MPRKATEIISPTQKKIMDILQILSREYPNLQTGLLHQSPFQLLVATILSAQCTDKQVNAVTPRLFKQFDTPKKMTQASITQLEKIIRPTGFFHHKAKNILATAQMIIREFQGNVPHTIDELVQLPGVGRKTANVVLGAVFDIPAMVVDTHVKRISQRLGLTKSNYPEQIEQDLMQILPQKAWNQFSLQLIHHGRKTCTSRNPNCSECSLSIYCEYIPKK